MSSILDALRKVEEDKAAQAAAESAPLDMAAAENELTGRRAERGSKLTVHLTPLTLAVAAVALAILVVAISVAVPYLLTRSTINAPREARTPDTPLFRPNASLDTAGARPAENVRPPSLPEGQNAQPSAEEAQAAPEPLSPEAGQTPVTPPAPDAGMSTAIFESETPPEPEEPKQEVVTAAPPPAKPAPAPVPAVREPEEEPEPKKEEVRESDPAPAPSVPEPAAPETPTVQGADPIPSDLTKLPVLTERKRLDLGLPRLKVNLVAESPRGGGNASAWALINKNKVYLNDYIYGTDAKLIGMSVRGVAIDVEGQRYFVPR